jgi:hypothetical protein
MKVSTNRIRIELLYSALTMRDLATRCGLESTAPLHPLVSQMVNKTGELVRLSDGRIALKNQRCALAEVWK